MATRDATLTSPHRGHEQREVMPTDRCVIMYDCPKCGRTLRQNAGDRCVFCSSADRPCPPMMARNA
jgi:hypothetical protein